MSEAPKIIYLDGTEELRSIDHLLGTEKNPPAIDPRAFLVLTALWNASRVAGKWVVLPAEVAGEFAGQREQYSSPAYRQQSRGTPIQEIARQLGIQLEYRTSALDSYQTQHLIRAIPIVQYTDRKNLFI